ASLEIQRPKGAGRPCYEAENSACRGEWRRETGSLRKDARLMSVRERESGELPSPICPGLTERLNRDLLFSGAMKNFPCSFDFFGAIWHSEFNQREKFMGRIYNNIVETVGRTPLVKLNK